jgi:Zn-dependent protease
VDLADSNVPAIIIAFLVLLFSLTVHEAAHAWTASRLGDDTARRLGRVSFNPIVHIDPVGTLLLPLVALASGSGFIFGWAKPTPVNVRNFQHPRRDNVLVTVAGPLSNLAIAIAAAIVLHNAHGITAIIALEALSLNVLLAIFNMLPIPPLDGGQAMLALLPINLAMRLRAVQPYGFLILLALIATGMLNYLIGPPYYLLLKWLNGQ